MTQCGMHIGDECQHLVLCRVYGCEMQRCLALCLTARPTPASSNARLVMASIRVPGLAARQYQLHQL